MFHSEKSLWPCDHDNPWAQAHLGANCVGGNCLRQRVSTSEEKLVDLKDLKECWKVSAPETLEILLPAHPAFLALKESLFPLLPAKDSNARVFSSHLINIAGHSWATTWKPNQHMGLIKNSVPQIWWFITVYHHPCLLHARASMYDIYYKYLCATFLDKPWQTHIWKSCHNAFWYILMMQDVKKLRQGLTADGVRSPCDLNQPLQRSYHFQPSCGRKQCQKTFFLLNRSLVNGDSPHRLG